MRSSLFASIALFVFAAFVPAPQGPCNSTGNVVTTPASISCTSNTHHCLQLDNGTWVNPCGRVCIETPASGRCDSTVFLAKHCCFNTTRPIRKTTYACAGTICVGTSSDEGLVTWGQIERCTQRASGGDWLNTDACDAGTRP